MAMRLSGLMSGMDTESVIEQLVMARRTKVDDTRKAQTKLQWKTDAWKTLNSKILKFYNGVLGTSMRFEGSYMKKTTKVSNGSIVSVITGENAMNSVQSLKVSQLAKSGYLTGGKLTLVDSKGQPTADKATTDTKLTALGIDLLDRGTIKVSVGGEEKEVNVAGATTVGELVQSFRDAGINASFDATNQRFYLASKGTGTENDFSISAGDAKGLEMLQKLGLSYLDDDVRKEYQSIIDSRNTLLQDRIADKVKELTTEKERLQGLLVTRLDDLKKKYKDIDFTGIPDEDGNVDVNEIRQKIKDKYVEAPDQLDDFEKWAGEWTDLTEQVANVDEQLADVEESVTAEVDTMIAEYQRALDDESVGRKDAAEDAEIYLNGVKYTSSRNTFEINGLTLTVNSTTAEGETVTLTTQDDTDGIYDMIKGFIKEYSELINEMDKLYNADSAKGYEPLTSEEKEAMSESEIEEWEKKIKDSVLRRDDKLGSLSNDLKTLMLSFSIEVGGKKMYLSNFGIETLSYFTAAENEKNAYHINGDPDDPNTASNPDDLRAMIANDPQTVIDFFVGLSRSMYSQLTDSMARTEYSSAYTAYEDVRMKKEYDDYTAKIKELEKKLTDYEDKWYQKFAKMETAMAKLQSSASAVTSLLGG